VAGDTSCTLTTRDGVRPGSPMTIPALVSALDQRTTLARALDRKRPGQRRFSWSPDVRLPFAGRSAGVRRYPSDRSSSDPRDRSQDWHQGRTGPQTVPMAFATGISRRTKVLAIVGGLLVLLVAGGRSSNGACRPTADRVQRTRRRSMPVRLAPAEGARSRRRASFVACG
jgi:hypothetical protein